MSEKRRISSGKAIEKHIRVDYLARTEGEAGIFARVARGEVKELRFNIWEPPRFFEGFLVGRAYYEVHDLVQRICGICPVSHMSTALRALEKAAGVEVSEQTRRLRRLLTLSQIMASHIIHIYMLDAPDYLGYDSIIPAISQRPELFQRFLQMKTAANHLTELIGGRALHPMTPVFGGFTRLPELKQLKRAAEGLKAIKQDALETVRWVAGLETIDFNPERPQVALRGGAAYPVNQARLASSTGLDMAEDDYRAHFSERQHPFANAKYSSLDGGDPFVVGARARVNLNFELLSADAQAIAREVGYRLPSYNPFLNSLAQAIEVVSGIDDCVAMIGELGEPRPEPPLQPAGAGTGGALTEAPRGLLYHFYQLSAEGLVERADIVTPTAHNAANIERDLNELLPSISHLSEAEITLRCEELIRAYDPCFSCSVH